MPLDPGADEVSALAEQLGSYDLVVVGTIKPPSIPARRRWSTPCWRASCQ